MHDDAMPVTSDVTILTDRGQLQVPAWVRERLALQPGQRFAWSVLPDGDLQVHVVRQEAIARRTQWRAYARTTQGDRTSDEILADLREGDADTKRELGL